MFLRNYQLIFECIILLFALWWAAILNSLVCANADASTENNRPTAAHRSLVALFVSGTESFIDKHYFDTKRMATTPQQPPFEQQQGYKGATQVPLKPKIAAQELNNLLTDSLRTKLTTTPAKALAPNFGSVVFAKTTGSGSRQTFPTFFSSVLGPADTNYNSLFIDTVGYVFQKLIDCGILSMPVLDVQTVRPPAPNFAAFLPPVLPICLTLKIRILLEQFRCFC